MNSKELTKPFRTFYISDPQLQVSENLIIIVYFDSKHLKTSFHSHLNSDFTG